MTKKKLNKEVKSKTLRGVGPIVRGSVVFVNISKLGELGDNGKAVMSVGYDRVTAKPDMPLVLAQWFIRELLPMCHYSSDDKMKADLASLKQYVSSIESR